MKGNTMKIKFRMLVALAILLVAVTGCGQIQARLGSSGQDTSSTFSIQANQINDKAISDYNNSVITIFQRDAIRNLLCDYQTAHNLKVKAGASEAELQTDFTAMQDKVAEIYKGGVK